MSIFKKKTKPSQNAFAVVTGAGSGIGRSFALDLAKRGGTILCADINLASAEETVDLIESSRRKSICLSMRCRSGRTSHENGG